MGELNQSESLSVYSTRFHERDDFYSVHRFIHEQSHGTGYGDVASTDCGLQQMLETCIPHTAGKQQ